MMKELNLLSKKVESCRLLAEVYVLIDVEVLDPVFGSAVGPDCRRLESGI
jgi:tryptophanase